MKASLLKTPYPGVFKIKGFRLSPEQKRQIQNRVEAWIEKKQCLLFLPKISYHWLALKMTNSQMIQASLKIKIGTRIWKGTGSGVTSFSAVRAALDALVPIPVSKTPNHAVRHHDEISHYETQIA